MLATPESSISRWIFPYKPSSYWGTPISGNPHVSSDTNHHGFPMAHGTEHSSITLVPDAQESVEAGRGAWLWCRDGLRFCKSNPPMWNPWILNHFLLFFSNFDGHWTFHCFVFTSESILNWAPSSHPCPDLRCSEPDWLQHIHWYCYRTLWSDSSSHVTRLCSLYSVFKPNVPSCASVTLQWQLALMCQGFIYPNHLFSPRRPSWKVSKA